MALCSQCGVDPCTDPWLCNAMQSMKKAAYTFSFTPLNLGDNLEKVTLNELKRKLITKFSPPIPVDVTVIHHKCGGEVLEFGYSSMGWSDDLYCRKCNKRWTDSEAEDSEKDFTGRDETVYKVVTQSKPIDEYGNTQTRAYSYLKAK
jgi:hypothetical protein